MKILFYGHEFHKVTRSSAFFVRFLETVGPVETRYGPNTPIDLDDPIFETDADVVVVWQLDFHALGFLNRGKRVLIAPMYDASGGRPAAHWRLLTDASFLAFSVTQHQALRHAGCESFLIKYFPEPQATEPKAFETKRLFFWQRRPRTGLNMRYVEKLFDGHVDHVHVHLATDPGEPETRAAEAPHDAPFRISTSSWLEDRSELDRLIDGCNLYLAPRPTEGIGMGFLEAMARGLVVFAHDGPTHNEYIASWVNGVLLDKDRTRDLPSEPRNRYEEMSRMAIRTVAEGHERYIERLPQLQTRLLELAEPRRPNGVYATPDFADLAEKAVTSEHEYPAALQAYSASHPSLAEELQDEDAPKTQGGLRPLVRALQPNTQTPLGLGPAESLLLSGWGRSEPKLTWSDGASAQIAFRLERALQGDQVELALTARTTRDLMNRGQPVSVALNGAEIGVFDAKDAFETHRFKIDPRALALGRVNVVTLSAPHEGALPRRSHSTAFAVSVVALEVD